MLDFKHPSLPCYIAHAAIRCRHPIDLLLCLGLAWLAFILAVPILRMLMPRIETVR